MTIPASNIATVNPGVISSGGSALALIGLILTANTATPLGTVQPFASVDAVAAFFGATSTEATLAAVYFNGYDNSTKKPASLLFSQYNAASVAAYLRGGSLAAMTLTQLQALSGILTITVDGVVKTTTSVNLSAATSFSNAATLISAGFTAGPVVAYDSQRAAFTFTSGTTGAASTIGFATGSLAAGLLLTAALGAVTSQGAIAATPAGAMAAIITTTQNWASFMTVFEPVLADKILFAQWVQSRNNRFAYVCWDTDANQIVANDTTAFCSQVMSLNLSGSVPIYRDIEHAAFVMGMIASVDFTRANGRITCALKSQGGLTFSVTDETTASILEAKECNFYGSYATANSQFVFFYPGTVGGNFSWLDEYVNQIWLNSQLQLAMMTVLTNTPSIPYNADGYALIDAACMDPIEAAVTFGAIRAGVPLSSLQAAQVNNAAGVKIDTVLNTRGWYLQILPATAQVRGLRQSPPMSLWYMDGGSVQRLVLASVVVQ